MRKPVTAGERALQIELVRARIALEREVLARSAKELGRDLTPGNLISGLFGRRGRGGRTGGGWLHRIGALARRYPMLLSVAGSALSGVGSKRRWWRAGAVLLGSAMWMIKSSGGGRRR